MEQCQNCGRTIGNLETANVWNDRIVCTHCYAALNPTPDYAGAASAPAAKSHRTLWIILGSIGSVLLLVVIVLAVLVILYRPHGHVVKRQLLAAPIAPQASADITIEYDKFHDDTMVTLGNSDDDRWRVLRASDGKYVPFGTGTDGMFVVVSYDFPHAAEVYRPELVNFRFTFNDTAENLDHPGDAIIFLLDGGRRISGRALYVCEYFTTVAVTADDALAISKANSVEVKVTGRAVKLTDTQLSALQSFLKSIGVG
jgi:hypothetical protein